MKVTAVLTMGGGRVLQAAGSVEMPTQGRLPRDLEEGVSEGAAVAAGFLKGSPSNAGVKQGSCAGNGGDGGPVANNNKHYGTMVSLLQEEALEVGGRKGAGGASARIAPNV